MNNNPIMKGIGSAYKFGVKSTSDMVARLKPYLHLIDCMFIQLRAVAGLSVRYLPKLNMYEEAPD